jgi:hypothetical protein
MAEDLLTLLIVAIVVGLPVMLIFGKPIMKNWLEHRDKRFELESRLAAENAARSAAHTDRLEQRVRVLERIVTDKGIVVADEIERLRDEPLN